MAVKTFGVCDFSRFAVMDWRLWFLALMTAIRACSVFRLGMPSFLDVRSVGQ